MRKSYKDMLMGLCPNARICMHYGLTEASRSTFIEFHSEKDKLHTVGKSSPNVEIRIESENGVELGPNQIGEILVKGQMVMKGYWNRPEETAKVMTEDGFFKTGDIGFMDEKGYFQIVDRKKDMILVSGFNVYPNEVEGVIVTHPKVFEVAAVGIPDEHSGEVVKIFVVKEDQSLTEEELMAFCKENLTGYKRPKAIEFRDELPKSNVGKILRKELRPPAQGLA